MATRRIRYFVRFFWVDASGVAWPFSRDWATGAVANETRPKVLGLQPPEGAMQAVQQESAASATGFLVLRLVDLAGEASRQIGSQQLTLAAALSAGGGETEVEFNETPAGLPARGTLQIEDERIRYTGLDLPNKKATGITRAVDGTSLAAHAIDTLAQNGEQIRPGTRVQLFEGQAPEDETAYASYTLMDVVLRAQPSIAPVFVVQCRDAQRFTRQTIFLAATASAPVIKEGNPITLHKQILADEVQVPAAQLDGAGFDALAATAPWSGQTYRFVIRAPQDARAFLAELHRSTGTWPFVTRDGKLSVKPVRLPPAGPFPAIGADDVVGMPQWAAADARIINQAIIRYDWDLEELPSDFGVIDVFEDTASRAIFHRQRALVIDARGVRGTLSGGDVAIALAQRIFDRFRLPASVFTARIRSARLRDLALGAFVEFTHPAVFNPDTGQRGITGAVCEVVDVRPVFGAAGPQDPPHVIATLMHTGVLTAAAVPVPEETIQALRRPTTTETTRGLVLQTPADLEERKTRVELLRAEEIIMQDGHRIGGWKNLVADITATGAGGLDQGTPVDSRWYAIHAIRNPDIDTRALLLQRHPHHFAGADHPRTAAAGSHTVNGENTKVAQSFQVTAPGILRYLLAWIAASSGLWDGKFWFTVEGDSAGEPDGVPLDTSVPFDVGAQAGTTLPFPLFMAFEGGVALTTGVTYWLVLNGDWTRLDKVLFWHGQVSVSGTYADGVAATWEKDTGLWTIQSDDDMWFQLFLRSDEPALVLPAGFTQRAGIGHVFRDSAGEFKPFMALDRRVRFTGDKSTYRLGDLSTDVNFVDLHPFVPPIPAAIMVAGNNQTAPGLNIALSVPQSFYSQDITRAQVRYKTQVTVDEPDNPHGFVVVDNHQRVHMRGATNNWFAYLPGWIW